MEWFHARISCLCWISSLSILAIGDAQGLVSLWQLDSLDEVQDTATYVWKHIFVAHHKRVVSICESSSSLSSLQPVSHFLTCSSHDRTIKRWTWKSHDSTLNNGEGYMEEEKLFYDSDSKTIWYGLKMLPNGYIAMASKSETTWQVWNPLSNRYVECFDGQAVIQHVTAVTVIDKKTHLLVTCIIGGIVELWNYITGSCEQRFMGHNKSNVTCCVELSCGERLASCSEDGVILIWNFMKNCIERTFDIALCDFTFAMFLKGKSLEDEDVPQQFVSCHSLFELSDRKLIAVGNDGLLKIWKPVL
jgi:WD40 repeat protein